MKAILYARVSSKEQEKEGFSIPAQQRLLKEYAAKSGFRIVEEFTDVETAKSTGRTEFGKMVDYLGTNPDVKGILVEKTDRLYRNFRDYVLLEDLDIEIHLVKENEVISKDSRSHAKLVHGIKVVLAKNYIDNLSEEVKKGMREKAEQGEWPSKAPIGYLNNKTTHLVELHSVKAPLVRRAFELYVSGQYSLDSLRKYLASLGLTSGSRRPLSKSMIEAILKNPFYYGEFVWKGNYYRGVHEPIISRELYDQVQTLLRRKGKPRIRRSFPFAGLLRCGRCGCSITAEIKKGKYVYYHCTNGKGKCDQEYVKEERLDELLAELVRAVQIDQDAVNWIVQALQSSASEEREFRQKETDRLQRQVDSLQSRLDGAYIDKLDGTIDEGYWLDLSTKWRGEQDTAMALLQRHRDSDRNYVDQATNILELAQQAYSQYIHQDPLEKRKLLDSLLSNCIIRGTTLYPTYKKPFDLIVEGVKMQEKQARTDNSRTFGAVVQYLRKAG